MVSSRRISRACFKAWPSMLRPNTKYQGKRRADRKRSGRWTTIYIEGWLRWGGVSQCIQGQGASHIFVRMSQCCLAGRYVRNLFARGRGQSGALVGRGVCAFGVARAKANAPQFVMGTRFGEAALASVYEGQAHFLVLEGFCQVASEDYVFAFLLPEIAIEVAYMTAEAFLLSGIVSNKYCRERHVVAE